MGFLVNSFDEKTMKKFLVKNKKPKNSNINYNSYKNCIKAEALRIKNLFQESIEFYLLAISYDNSNYEAFKGLGNSYKDIGFIKSAIEAFHQAKKLLPFDINIYYELGCCYSLENNFIKASEYFSKCLKIDPGFIDAKFKLGLTMEFRNKNKEAIEIYKEIINKSPEYIAAYNNLASLFMRLGFYSKAIDIFKTSLKIDPNFSRAILGIAISLDKANNKIQALRYYKKFLKIDKRSKNTPYVVERIKEIYNEKKSVTNKNIRLVIA